MTVDHPSRHEGTTRMIDQIRASRLPSNMMQFAARGALQVPPAENIEILVYLTLHNKVFGDLARMTLAGWDEKSSLASVADPNTPQEVLNYFISSDNLRPRLLPALLENPSIREEQLVKLATSALRETIDIMLKSARVRTLHRVLDALHSNPYLRKEEAPELERLMEAAAQTTASADTASPLAQQAHHDSPASETAQHTPTPEAPLDLEAGDASEATFGMEDETVFAYFQEHAADIAAEGDKPFHAIGGIVDLLGAEYFPVLDTAELPPPEAPSPHPAAKPVAHAPHPPAAPKRENTFQKINSLDVKGRIQLALKGNKEERSILIRDGTKVVALAVLEAPKLSDGEVEKFASQKNVLEAVLRQIPLKRRFMKNYIVVRNLVANPRTPLDLGLGLMKNLLTTDLKNLSSNKEVSETIRKLAMKMYKQKLDAANKK
jgi:hypothetical protein